MQRPIPLFPKRTHGYWLIAILAVAAAVRFMGWVKTALVQRLILDGHFDGWWEMTEKCTGKTAFARLASRTFLYQFADATAHGNDFWWKMLCVRRFISNGWLKWT